MKWRCFVRNYSLICVISLLDGMCSGRILTTSETQQVMEKLFTNRSHISSTIPAHPGHPVKIYLSLIIEDMAPLEVFHDHIFVECYLQMAWVDDRLKFNTSVSNGLFVLTSSDVKNIWLPDLWISGERGHDKDNFVNDNSLAQINRDGRVTYSSRLSVHIFCAMNYTKFPFDKQLCGMPLESFAYSSELLQLLPSDNREPISLSTVFGNSKYILERHTISLKQVDYGDGDLFDQLLIQLQLRREINYYLMEYHLPLALVVSASWISFWLDYRSTPARVTLPVTTFLTLINMAENIRSRDFNFQTFSTVLEIYISVCTLYVFGALVEYAIVGGTYYAGKKSKAVKEAKEEHFLDEAFSHENINTLSLDSISVSETIRGEEQCIKEELNAASIDVGVDDEEVEDFENFDKKLEEDDIDLYKNQVEGYHIVDTYSRVLFPATFVMFNVTYALVLWLTY